VEGTENSTMRYDARILQHVFPTVLFATAGETIHLTFDDGPHPIGTLNILNILKTRDVFATFFVNGENVRKYPELTRQIKAEGHQIGNHSYTHTNLFFKKKEIVQKEILETEEILEETIGVRSHFFRPPYGYFNLRILQVMKKLGMTCVLWSVNSKDFKLNSHLNVAHRVVQQTVKGSILLFHDNNNTSQTSHLFLPALLDKLLDNGFVFNTLPL
jgi:peptidoglycan/xylan/chitin deacetylase (PgdA/CDA1 family)